MREKKVGDELKRDVENDYEDDDDDDLQSKKRKENVVVL